jgi:hypothetical protein
MVRVKPPDGAVEPYTKRWAVIVGINYTDSKLDGDDRKVVPALNNAENDAKAVKELLVKHYGYKEECIRYLIGKYATKAAIEKAIGDDFLRNKTKVTDMDSVLFFFAGHGVHLEKEKRSGELIPWDVKVAGKIPTFESCIKLQATSSPSPLRQTDESSRHCGPMPGCFGHPHSRPSHPVAANSKRPTARAVIPPSRQP